MKNVTIVALTLLIFSTTHVFAQPSGTLPILHIQTANNASITSKDTYLNATYWITATTENPSDGIGSAEAPLAMQIRGRGNWTWTGFEKKPYRIKLGTKASLLGLNSNKHFALLAHADDNKGFLRNTLGFRVSELLGLAWTPQQRPIEVVLNNEYIGLYFLTETIRVDKQRVNIVEQRDLCTQQDSITGGWLIEIDNYNSDPHITIEEGDGVPIYFTYHSPEVLSAAQEAFLTQEMSRINNLIYGDKTSEELWQYVDIDALAKFYIVQEITDNYESFHGSCYLYRDMGADKKWTFGPVWDFGSSFNYTKSQYCYEGREHHQTWIGEICKFPAFQRRVEEIWQDFASNHYNELYTYIDTFCERIGSAAQQDAKRWPEYGNKDVKKKANEVKNILIGTRTWLSSQWGGIEDERTKWTIWFVDNGIPQWEEVRCYVWDDNAEGFSGCYMPLGEWSGTTMQTIESEGNAYYSLSFTTDYPLSPTAGIIFNDGSLGAGHQTADLVLENNSIYNREGKIGSIPSGDGLEEVTTDEPCIYYTLQGLPVKKPQTGQVYIVRRGNHVEKRYVW